MFLLEFCLQNEEFSSVLGLKQPVQIRSFQIREVFFRLISYFCKPNLCANFVQKVLCGNNSAVDSFEVARSKGFIELVLLF